MSGADPVRQVQGFRLSVQQQHIWQVRMDGGATWAQGLLSVAGPLDVERLAAAITDVADRHPILRTSYRRVPGLRSPVQVVAAPGVASPRMHFEDLCDLDEAAQQYHLNRAARGEREAVDVGTHPVLRTRLFALAPQRHGLLLTTTPLTADAETMRQTAAAIADAYRGGNQQHQSAVEYAHVVEWQHEIGLDSPVPDAVALLAAGSDPAAARRLPLQHAGGPRSPETETIETELPGPTGAAVHRYARSRGVAPRTVLLAAWQALLAQITGAPDIVVGTRLEGRGYEELVGCLGHFAKWVPITGRVRWDTSFDTLTAALENELTRADEIEEQLLGQYAAGVNAWTAAFDCVPEYEAYPAGDITFAFAWCDVAAEPYSVKLECVVGEDAVRAVWHYRRADFDPDYVGCLATQYRTLLAGLLADPAVAVRAVSCLDAATRERLVRTVNETARDLPGGCLHQLFEGQAGRTPDAVAVLDPTRRMTYRELDERAEQLARGLRAHGVGPETRVGVCLPHCVDLVAVILAVLKAGGAYVPLDPAQPWRRIQALVAESRCRVVVATDEAPAPWDDGTAERLGTNQLAADGVDTGPPGGHPAVVSENLAYVIFTSGSTGAPKGVMVPHRAIVNYLSWGAETYTGGGPAALVHSSVAFDLTVTSLFLPLVTGRSVHLDDRWRDALVLSREVAGRSGLYLLKFTPSHLALVNRVLAAEELAGTTGCLVVGGEQLTGGAVRPWRRHTPATRVFNEYGPTEAAVGCCVHEVGGEPDGDAALPIGRPIANTRIYVFDADMEPVGVGVVGEIYLGGHCLARGYLGRPDLTADRFVPDPFAQVPGQRLYRTGDLACHDPHGEVRFVGRLDEQIKVRGARVEPAEVQVVLRSHPAVSDAAVVSGPDGSLTAYLVAVDPTGTDVELRAYVADRLPGYMVPERYRWIDAIPLTANGKLDRTRLDGRAAPVRRSVTAPGDVVELTVVRLMEELLDRAPVGVDEDFFELGGHSMLAVRLIARINVAFRTDLPVSVFFEHAAGNGARPATAAHLAQAVRAGANRADEPLVLLRDGTGTPLFCVHPAGGDIVGFRDLSLSGALRRPMYGLQAPPPEDPGGEQSVEFLAQRYLSALRQAQPTGPYLLLGWSMGGLVAYEMARRLADSGERVGMLALVETYPGEVLPDDTATAASRHLAGELGRLVGLGLPLDLGELRRLPGDEAARQVLAAAASAGLVSSERERADLGRRIRLNHLHVRAAGSYRLASYAGAVTLVQASETGAELRRDALAAWRRSCTGQVSLHELPGEHFTLLRRPAVDDLAKIVESAAGAAPPEPVS